MPAPDGPRIFAAAPPPGQSASSLDAPSSERHRRRNRVTLALGELLSQAAAGKLTEADLPRIERSLLGALDGWGERERHAAAVSIITRQLYDQAQREHAQPSAGPLVAGARSALAAELTRQLLLMAEGRSAGADGIDVPLPAGYERATWNQLGGFDYREGQPLPAAVKALSGRRVALAGFMLSLGETGELREFILVESLWGCCFGNVPEMNQMLLVRARHALPYTPLPVLVAGTLQVGEERDGVMVTSVYRLGDAEVMPLPEARNAD